MVDISVDTHKLMYHPERVSQWKEKGDCYPVYVEAGLTNACNHNCIFCALDFLGNSANFISTPVMLSTIKNMASNGVKSIMFAGEGESVLHKDIGLFTQTAKQSGMHVSVTTNGVPFTSKKIQECMPNLTWIRFSVDSGTSENYSLIHGCPKEDFEKLLTNMQEAIDFKKKNNLKTTIGVQFLMIPPNRNQAVILADKLREIGADNLQVKPYSHHPSSKNDFSIHPDEYNEIEKELKEFNTSNFKVMFRRQTIDRLKNKPYDCCFGTSFIALIDARGNVFPCNIFYNTPAFTYGNLYNQSFSEIWESERRKEILKKIKVDDKCRLACRLDVINRYLHRLKNPELHDNFI